VERDVAGSAVKGKSGEEEKFRRRWGIGSFAKERAFPFKTRSGIPRAMEYVCAWRSPQAEREEKTG